MSTVSLPLPPPPPPILSTFSGRQWCNKFSELLTCDFPFQEQSAPLVLHYRAMDVTFTRWLTWQKCSILWQVFMGVTQHEQFLLSNIKLFLCFQTWWARFTGVSRQDQWGTCKLLEKYSKIGTLDNANFSSTCNLVHSASLSHYWDSTVLVQKYSSLRFQR